MYLWISIDKINWYYILYSNLIVMKKIVVLFVASFCLFSSQVIAQTTALVVLEVTETTVKLGLVTQNTEDTFYGNLKCASTDSAEFFMEGAMIVPTERFVQLSGLSPGVDYTAMLSGTFNGVDWFDTQPVSFTTLGGSVSIEEAEAPSFTIFPNPTSDFVSAQGLEIGETIRFLDLTGKILNEVNVSNETMVIDLTTLKPGLYIVQTGTALQRVVKH